MRVQRWVMSALLLTTATLFSGGLALVSLFVEDRGGSRIGLLVIAAVVGLAAMVGVRFLNEKPWLTSWLLLGLLPVAVAGYLGYLA